MEKTIELVGYPVSYQAERPELARSAFRNPPLYADYALTMIEIQLGPPEGGTTGGLTRGSLRLTAVTDFFRDLGRDEKLTITITRKTP